MVPNLDALAQKRRDKAAARGCGKALLAESAAFKPGAAQNRYRATAQLSRVKPDIPERAHVKHVFVKTATRVNKRAGNSRQPTRRRERQMCSFRDARRTQASLSCFGRDPAALRVAQTSNERGMSSCCTQRTLRHMAWLDYYWRSRENYLIRITTLELHR
jgi:putative transposase